MHWPDKIPPNINDYEWGDTLVERWVGQLIIIRGQFDAGYHRGWESQLFSLLFSPVIIFKWPHIRHSPASLSPAWENLHHLHLDSVKRPIHQEERLVMTSSALGCEERDRKGLWMKVLRWPSRVFPHQGNCRMAHVSIIYPRAQM